jgi:hypothetical protein
MMMPTMEAKRVAVLPRKVAERRRAEESTLHRHGEPPTTFEQ